MIINQYREKYSEYRIKHWDNVAKQSTASKGRYYHSRVEEIYRFLIPPGQHVLELGCGTGDLLSSLRPSYGVGVDFSSNMLSIATARHPEINFICADVHDVCFNTSFDVIVLNDILNDLWDVQLLFKTISKFSNHKTRIVMNVFSRLWQPALDFARKKGWATPLLKQNWLTPEDLRHLMHLEGFEVVKKLSDIVVPLPIPLISSFCNKYLAKLFPFNFFNLTHFLVARKVPDTKTGRSMSVSVIVPARNEAGNIEEIIKRVPSIGSSTEIIFVEGGSTDNTCEAINSVILENPSLNIRLYHQTGQGKGDAVRLGFSKAAGDVLMILDADMTVPPEDLLRFYQALADGRGEFINGVRLVYPMQDQAMRFFNLIGNKFFSLAFSWLLGQPVKDTLCGTKVLTNRSYRSIAANRSFFGDFDPFGDFDLLFGAAKQNLKIVDLPVRYHERTYGETNIQRWRHGVMLLRMVLFAARRIKFI
ncbi:glycosyltransferase [Desulfonatronovibrio magnus]|uniref:glycosyltransferase n=1 Tax=Desulfonatronovibrio magnus TaxID=698827 RepID=UPI0005EB6ADF|nr:glycosyltransferase [Desulfonatronovibrio magnus]